VIVAEYKPRDIATPPKASPPYLFVLSATSEEILQAVARQHLDFVRACSDEDRLAEICYTSCVGRSHLEMRLAVVSHDLSELRESLERYLEGGARVHANGTSERAQVLREAARRYAEGESQPDWTQVFDGKEWRRLSLPLYPLEKTDIWLFSVAAKKLGAA